MTAKGLEDTAFYRYNRFIALNEVGGDPARFGATLAAFHRANQLRAQRWPHAMLATSTHDTKRGEDARARLAALSEFPDEWARQIPVWSRILRGPGATDGCEPANCCSRIATTSTCSTRCCWAAGRASCSRSNTARASR